MRVHLSDWLGHFGLVQAGFRVQANTFGIADKTSQNRINPVSKFLFTKLERQSNHFNEGITYVIAVF